MFLKSGFVWLCLCVLACIIRMSAAFQHGRFFKSPNIVFIMVDDMGWNDVSFHGSDQIRTPNIDRLAYQSVILQQYYSEAICTPARTALLTGKYPMRLGMHGMPLFNSEDRGIPLTEKLLPAYLKELGYSTHLVGKWHVGMSRKQYLPTSRGYDTHYGMRGGFIDYYTYNKVETWPNGRLLYGLDLFDNDKPQHKEQRYIVDALTDRAINIIRQHNSSCPLFLHVTHNAPHAGNGGAALQPPLFSTINNRHIANSDRRLYAEIVTHVDKSVGEIVNALSEMNMLDDTIIIFASDNGAPTNGDFTNWGVNLPFRGKKYTPWEGGVRVPAFIWHSSFRPNVWNGLMHISDWLPTLLTAAGGEIDRKIDGVNQWEAIIRNQKSQRNEVLLAVEDSSRNVYAAYRYGDYKIVVGNVTGLSNGYYGQEYMTIKGKMPEYLPSLRSCKVAEILERMGSYLFKEDILAMRYASTIPPQGPLTNVTLCVPTPTRGCLFNIPQDPSERRDLWEKEKTIANTLTSRLRNLWQMQQRRGPPALSLDADPANYNYTWMPWINNLQNIRNKTEAFSINNSDVNRKSVFSTTNLQFGDINSNVQNITIAAVVNCEGATLIRNLLCILRSVF
ncbi:arylsulfatase B-like [Battus philenor]|uniref:arylsulfatase B-like n=1 Tax=Battus philenor TaxID=42288 RepID=UPI0035D0B741